MVKNQIQARKPFVQRRMRERRRCTRSFALDAGVRSHRDLLPLRLERRLEVPPLDVMLFDEELILGIVRILILSMSDTS